MKNMSFLIVISSLLICSCSSPFLEFMKYKKDIETTTTESPLPSLFLNGAQRIIIKWNSQKDAEYYELFKDTEINGKFTEKIYTGSETSFIDKNVLDNKFYYYKLLCRSDFFNYRISAPSCGIYSSAVNSIENTSEIKAADLTLNTETNITFYNFYNALNVRNSSVQFFKSSTNRPGLVLNVKHNLPASIELNTDLYIRYYYGEYHSAEYKLEHGKHTKIPIPNSGDVKYFRIRAESNAALPVVEDVGLYSLSLAEETYVKRDVNVKDDGGAIIVSWISDSNDIKYEIFRNENNGEYSFVGFTGGIARYADSNVITGTDYRYFVIIYTNGGYVEYSNISNAAYIMSDLYMTDFIRGSKLEYNNMIKIEWNAVSGADGYKLYRYASKSDSNPVSITVTGTSYEDVDAEGDMADKLYFYRISCIVDGREYQKSRSWAWGIYHHTIDSFEAGIGNDDVNNVLHQPTDMFNTDTPPVIFTLSDGEGNKIKDIDWYKYRGTSKFIKVTVTSTFNAGELVFRWYYKNNYSGVSTNLGYGENILIFDDFEAAGEEELYFEITTNSSILSDKIGTYKVKISETIF